MKIISSYKVLPQVVSYRARRKANRLTAPNRALPDFLGIGAQRSGTTSLLHYLQQHPQVKTGLLKEIHYFDLHYHKGELWYKAHFPLKGRLKANEIVGEYSPYYLVHPHAAKRIHSLLPAAKLIVLLRNPKERAISNYHLEVGRKHETLPLMAALQAEEERTAQHWQRMLTDETYTSKNHLYYAYKQRGLYAEQLERYLEYFHRKQLLIIESKRLSADPQAVMEEVCDFLEISRDIGAISFSAKNVQAYKKEIPREVNDYLNEYFSEPNRRLYELIGQNFGW